jgi:hypothetical protein
MKKTAFRQTLQIDTPYYRDRIGESFNVKHSISDPSHTFQSKTVTNARGRYGVYYLKPKGKELDSKKIQHVRKVTQDYDNRPILRLTEQRDMYGGWMKEDKINPLEKYRLTKEANKEYFKEARSATSLEERVKINMKHTDRENHPERLERGPFKAYNKFKADHP